MKKILLTMCLLLPVSGSFAQLISVRHEAGFSFYHAPGDRIYLLAYNAPPVLLDGYSNLFTISYRENAFILTALADNQETRGSFPFGFAAYYPDVEPIPIGYFAPSGFSWIVSNRLGFIPMNAFPQIAGREYRVPIPPFEAVLPTPVPEPATWSLSGALALVTIACLRRLKKSRPDNAFLAARIQPFANTTPSSSPSG